MMTDRSILVILHLIMLADQWFESVRETHWHLVARGTLKEGSPVYAMVEVGIRRRSWLKRLKSVGDRNLILICLKGDNNKSNNQP
jgi:hypothetical protein